MSIVLLSGGLDSVTLLYGVVKKPHLFGVNTDERTHAVHFNCGNANAPTAADFCRHHCALLNVGLRIVDLSGVWPSGTMAKGAAPKEEQDPLLWLKKKAGNPYWKKQYDYQDARGMLFLTYAALAASTMEMRDVFLAFQSDAEEWAKIDKGDTEGLFQGDGSYAFVNAFTELMESGGFHPERIPRMRVPFMDSRMDKSAILVLADELNVDSSKTITCDFSYPPCQKCFSCRRRAKAERAKRQCYPKP